MIVHYCIFALLIVIGFFFEIITGNKKSKIMLILSFFILFFFATFRNYNVGNDTPEYFRVFQNLTFASTLNQAFELTRFEKGYTLLNFLIIKLGGNFTTLLGCISFIYLFSVMRFINKFSSSNFLGVLLFFCSSLYYDLWITMRQCIAIAIFLYGIEYLQKEKYVKYIIFILIASSFHITAIMLIFLIFMPKVQLSDKKDIVKIMGLCILLLMSLNYLIQIGVSVFPYYAHYLSSMYSEGGVRVASIVQFSSRIIIFLLFSLLNGFSKEDSLDNNLLTKFVVLDLSILLISLRLNLLDRFESYFSLGTLIMFLNSVSNLSRKEDKFFIRTFIILFIFIISTVFLYSRSNWYGIFPYSFVF